MPPAKTDQLDLWAESGLDGDDQVMVDFLLPTGIYIQMEVPRESTIQHIKLLLWKKAQEYPLFSLLGEMEGHMFECVNQAAVHEELEDETRRLCDVRPFLPVLKLITRNCGRAERLLDSKIGVLIGKGLHELDALQDQEVKDFRSKMKRISEEKMYQMQMMSWGEWLRSCYSPQLETGFLDGLIDKHEGVIKITMHYDQSQDTASLKVSLHCTVSELMDQSLKKWQTTHGPEDDIGARGDYVLRVSGKMEFLFEDHPLNQYKYIRACLLANENPHLTMVHCSIVKAMFEREVSTIGSVLARKSSNPPLPLPPKKRQTTVLHTCIWKVHSLFRINLVKGNKVNADDAAKVNIVNACELRVISLTLTLYLPPAGSESALHACLFKGAVSSMSNTRVKGLACNTHSDVSKKARPTSKLIQITKSTYCFTEEFMQMFYQNIK